MEALNLERIVIHGTEIIQIATGKILNLDFAILRAVVRTITSILLHLIQRMQMQI